MPTEENTSWSNWMLQQAERLPFIGDRVAAYRTEQTVSDRREGLAIEPPDPMDLWTDAIAVSGLSAPDKAELLSMVLLFEHEFPAMDPAQLNQTISDSIEYLNRRSEDKIAEHQMTLFTEDALANAAPQADRMIGISRLESLASAMAYAESQMTDDLGIPDPLMLGPWDQVDDAMERVCDDPRAVAVATEWGMQLNDDKSMLLSKRGMNLTSDDLRIHIALERGQDPALDILDAHTEALIQAQMGRPVLYEYDTPNDYAEAYADVANDATLCHRLENESPIDILKDARNQTRRSAGLDTGR